MSGVFHGRVEQVTTLVCPKICVGLRHRPPATIARFSFQVTLDPPQASGPTFAGLETATICSGMGPAKVVPLGRMYTLTWAPATDPVTPSDQIVYEIFSSSISGGEAYAHPLATSNPGATSYSGTLAGAGAAFFVVRARDQAGRLDGNRVQRQAVNHC